MTRVCSRCQCVLGEKCRRCGTEAQPITVNASGNAVVGTEFLCPNCNYKFGQGDGGKTNGLCPTCLEAARREVAAP